MTPEPDVFAALADPTRRTVLQEVATRGSATATELSAPLGITRQAVAKHLGVLADAGLVDGRRAGRETRYRPTPAPLGRRDLVDGGGRRALGHAPGRARAPGGAAARTGMMPRPASAGDQAPT